MDVVILDFIYLSMHLITILQFGAEGGGVIKSAAELIQYWPAYHSIIYASPGIFRDKTMDDKFMYFPNDDEQNYSSC